MGKLLEGGKLAACNGRPQMAAAVKHYKKAAELDCKEAMVTLGHMYEKGTPEVERNVELAMHYYQVAAEDGHDMALNYLGSFEYNRKRDFRKAAGYFKRAADKGNARALNNLGTCYELGHGVERDLEQAFVLYAESAQKGYSHGMFNLGYMYFQKGK